MLNLFVGKGQSQGCAGSDAGTGGTSVSDALVFEFQIIPSCGKMELLWFEVADKWGVSVLSAIGSPPRFGVFLSVAAGARGLPAVGVHGCV